VFSTVPFCQESALGYSPSPLPQPLIPASTPTHPLSIWLPHSGPMFCQSPSTTSWLPVTSQAGSSAVTLAHLPVRQQLLPVLGQMACQGMIIRLSIANHPRKAQAPCPSGSCPEEGLPHFSYSLSGALDGHCFLHPHGDPLGLQMPCSASDRENKVTKKSLNPQQSVAMRRRP
jgi:hypothetical protein